MLVQHVHRDARNRSSDRHVARNATIAPKPGQIAERRRDGRFGGSIGIEELHPSVDQLGPALHLLRYDPLTADDDGTDRFRKGDALQFHARDQFVPVGGRQIENCHVQPTAGLEESRHGIHHRGAAQNECSADRETRKDLLCSGVEAQGGELQHAVLTGEPNRAADRPDVIRDGPVLDQHALRLSG